MTPSKQIKHLERQIRLEQTNNKYLKIQALKLELNQLRGGRPTKFKLPSTSKLLTAFLLLNLSVMEAYSMWVMYRLSDLSSLSTLITCVIGEVVTYFIYSLKSLRENTAGGIIHDMAVHQTSPDNPETAENTQMAENNDLVSSTDTAG